MKKHFSHGVGLMFVCSILMGVSIKAGFAAPGAAEEHRQNGIQILSATYGRLIDRNYSLYCEQLPQNEVEEYIESMIANNGDRALITLKEACENKKSCSYLIDHTVIGDPVVGCPKKFELEYRCSGKKVIHEVVVGWEASGKTAELVCPKN